MGGLASLCGGTGLLTPTLFTQGSQLLKGEVPSQWTLFWEGPENPSSWLLQFSKKASQLTKWMNNTKQGSILDSEVNLNHIYHSEIFLNCLRQMTARQL